MLGAVQTSLSRRCLLAFLLSHAKCWLQMWKTGVRLLDLGSEKKIPVECYFDFSELVMDARQSPGKEVEEDLVRSSQHPGKTWYWESSTVLLCGVSVMCRRESGGRLSESKGTGCTGLCTVRSTMLFSCKCYLRLLLANMSYLQLEGGSWLSVFLCPREMVLFCSRHDKACESHHPKHLASAWVIVLLPCFTIPSCFAASEGLLALWPAHSTLKTDQGANVRVGWVWYFLFPRKSHNYILFQRRMK